MGTVQVIKQIEERKLANEVTLMVWSDRMDLVALANVKGEVALHRLTGLKACSLNPPKEGMMVTGMAWRPDGKVLAIAYSLGQVYLVKVENKQVLHTIEIGNEITCLNWFEDKSPKEKLNNEEESKASQYMSYIDKSDTMLPKPETQAYDCSEGSASDAQKDNILHHQTDLNLLFIGTSTGQVHIEVFGCFPCAIIDISSQFALNCSIESIHLTESLSRIFVTIRDEDNNLKVLLFNADIFTTYTNELFALALKHIKLMYIINYLKSTMTAMFESYEIILLEFDLKLSKYAEKVAEGGVTADFLELLLFGIASDEMKEFLLHDLTRKGLEKFGRNIDLSYSNIEKLLLKHVMKYGQNITFHLTELRGMARLEHRYKSMGLMEDSITQAILYNGAFLIKCAEMQQVMTEHTHNFQAFFRWLYTSTIHVMEIPLPNDIPKMTQQDLACITEFLQNFDKIGNNSGQSQFVMERLGQYLNDSDLVIPANMEGNDWARFLDENHCLNKNDSILKHFPNASLVQQFKHLVNKVDLVFSTPKDVIIQQFHLLKVFDCCNFANSPKVSHVNLTKDIVYFAFLEDFQTIYCLQIDSINFTVMCIKIYFTNLQSNNMELYNVLDVKLYTNSILSVLLQENNASKLSVLYQMPLTQIVNEMTDLSHMENEQLFTFKNIASANGSNLGPKVFKVLEGMNALQFAVSGTRKVGIVLSETKRKVRLFEMEAEEEDDEDAEMSFVSGREGDLSLQDASYISR